MGKTWNKGHTRHTHASVARISQTMRDKRLDNFASWRQSQRKEGKLGVRVPVLAQCGESAELLGVVLGDGYIGQHPRTQCLRIVSNASNIGFIERYTEMIEVVFQRKPSVRTRKHSNAVDIVLYEQDIAERLGLHTGAKTHRPFTLPVWIRRDKELVLRFLRGLYEADGCLAHHEATYTHKFIFRNYNEHLLILVYDLLCGLGFHPHQSATAIQVSRKKEVEKLSKIVHFREYP